MTGRRIHVTELGVRGDGAAPLLAQATDQQRLIDERGAKRIRMAHLAFVATGGSTPTLTTVRSR